MKSKDILRVYKDENIFQRIRFSIEKNNENVFYFIHRNCFHHFNGKI